jgi:outer membrane protein OmpA-like peptidoglycan-associated protein
MKGMTSLLALALSLNVLPTVVAAQVVLREGDVTEETLVKALSPPARTRNLSRDPVKPMPQGNPSASILITFETNSTQLTSQAKSSLDVVGRALASDRLADFSFRLEGHADPRGASDLNQGLSEGRARAVRQYLVDNHKIPPSRLKSVGKGDREPLNRNDPAAAENRRVTIVTLAN